MVIMKRYRCFFIWAGLLALSTLLHTTTWGGIHDSTRLVSTVNQLVEIEANVLVAVTQEKGGLFVSYDGGTTWQHPVGVPEIFYNRLDKVSSEHLFLTTAEGVFQTNAAFDKWKKISDRQIAAISCSTDMASCLVKEWGRMPYFLTGEDWVQGTATHQEVVGLDFPIQSLVRLADGQMFAASYNHGCFTSRDDGRNWLDISAGLQNLEVTVLLAGPDRFLYAGTFGGGLHRYRVDVGWEKITALHGNEAITALASSDKGLIVAGTETGQVWISKDDGLNWEPVTIPGGQLQVTSMAVIANGQVIVGVQGRGLFSSIDFGARWRPRPFAYMNHILRVSVTDSGTWFVAVKGLGVLRSIDHGVSWSPLQMPCGLEDGLAIASVGEKLFLSTYTSGPYVFIDGDNSWHTLTDGLPPEQTGASSIRDDGFGQLYIATTDGQGLYLLDKATSAWQMITADDEYGDSYTAWDLMFPPGGEAIAFGYSDVLISRSGKRTWGRHHFGQRSESVFLDVDSRLWTERAQSIFAYAPKNDEWEQQQHLPERRYVEFQQIDSGLYAARRVDKGLDLVERHGSSLQPLRTVLGDRTVLSLAYDQQADMLLAGCDRGLFVSVDKGATLRELNINQ